MGIASAEYTALKVRFAVASGLVVGGLVAASLWAAAASGATNACKPTVSDGFGPWAQAARAAPRRSVFGSGFTLSGTVLSAGDCKPVKGAVVEVWQETPGLGYVRRGRASVLTDETGAFRIVGPVPRGEAGGLTGHIHIRVTHSLFEELAVTHFVAQGSHRARLTLVLTDSQL
jgi:protocatechuate 3,4-dioxygenase beta subunit